MNNNDINEAKKIILNKINSLTDEFNTVGDFTLDNEPSLEHIKNKLALFNEAFEELINDGFVKCVKHDKKQGAINPSLTRAGRNLF